MNPDAKTLWPHPQWVLAALLAALGTLGPFSIDTYLPAFFVAGALCVVAALIVLMIARPKPVVA